MRIFRVFMWLVKINFLKNLHSVFRGNYQWWVFIISNPVRRNQEQRIIAKLIIIIKTKDFLLKRKVFWHRCILNQTNICQHVVGCKFIQNQNNIIIVEWYCLRNNDLTGLWDDKLFLRGENWLDKFGHHASRIKQTFAKLYV